MSEPAAPALQPNQAGLVGPLAGQAVLHQLAAEEPHQDAEAARPASPQLVDDPAEHQQQADVQAWLPEAHPAAHQASAPADHRNRADLRSQVVHHQVRCLVEAYLADHPAGLAAASQACPADLASAVDLVLLQAAYPVVPSQVVHPNLEGRRGVHPSSRLPEDNQAVRRQAGSPEGLRSLAVAHQSQAVRSQEAQSPVAEHRTQAEGLQGSLAESQEEEGNPAASAENLRNLAVAAGADSCRDDHGHRLHRHRGYPFRHGVDRHHLLLCCRPSWHHPPSAVVAQVLAVAAPAGPRAAAALAEPPAVEGQPLRCHQLRERASIPQARRLHRRQVLWRRPPGLPPPWPAARTPVAPRQPERP